ncbi:hypothetical protein SAMN05216581_1571 [Pseudomonas asplenii]|uniref:Uncharacterized protein n=1 Tax=Pseudomonas asplenii TaxID=53407 RepID=A0A1H6N196_9PSED|nr:hypothetical protein SAMN05216581_1571 [Pseudomonas fuscovaginae]
MVAAILETRSHSWWEPACWRSAAGDQPQHLHSLSDRYRQQAGSHRIIPVALTKLETGLH